MPKRVIVCCDGTWNTAGQRTPTNVVRFHERIAPIAPDGTEQRAFYHPGVGTRRWDRLRGGAFGFGLSEIVKDAYRLVIESYEPGDELFLVGFSRGAFTARSTAGLIRNCGVLRRGELSHIDDAYALYRTKEGPDAPAARAFRERHAFADRTPIRFIGVWDTVGSLGIPNLGLPGLGWFVRWVNRRWAFHDVTLSSRVACAYQALAIDESRRPFAPAVWRPQPHAHGQEVEQIWFAGVHCDIGGGYPERGLAEITLWWMADRARHCGLAFTDSPTPAPAEAAMDELHDSRTGLYRLLAPYERRIGVTDPDHEALASTADTRYDAGGYAPPGLVTYLDGPHREAMI